MPSTNITMLKTVAFGLGDLKDEMVFVGGAVAELYAKNHIRTCLYSPDYEQVLVRGYKY